MMEILEYPELLRARDLDLGSVTLSGVALGSPSAALPRERIREVGFSPIVVHFRLERDGTVQYYGHGNEFLELDRVIDSVLCEGGVVHALGDHSFTIEQARVTKFSLYGSALESFASVQDWSLVMSVFGHPDRIVGLRADGDLLAYDLLYRGAKKWIRYDVVGGRLSFVVLGGSLDDVRVEVRGGIARFEVPTCAG